MIQETHIQIYSKTQCPYCDAAERIAQQMVQETSAFTYNKYMLNEDFTREQLMEKFPGARTFPHCLLYTSPSPRD